MHHGKLSFVAPAVSPIVTMILPNNAIFLTEKIDGFGATLANYQNVQLKENSHSTIEGELNNCSHNLIHNLTPLFSLPVALPCLIELTMTQLHSCFALVRH